MAQRRWNALDLLAFLVAAVRAFRQQLRVGVPCARVAQNGTCAQFASVGHAHADGAIAGVHQNAFDFGAHQDLAASAFDHRLDRRRDPRRSAYRIISALQIVLHHHGVYTEAALRGRQPIIAPLAGEHAEQFAVARNLAQNFRGGTRSVLQKLAPHPATRDTR